MHLAAGSDLIDAGVNVGIPFAGTAPDLGCFETGLTGVNHMNTPGQATFYPNPVKSTGYIHFDAEIAGRCQVRLHDVTGRLVKTVADSQIEPGENILTADLSDIRDGRFFCRVLINGQPHFTVRIMKSGKTD
jgi:hypothetical protein